MRIPLQAVSDGLFVDELQDVLLSNSITAEQIGEKFGVTPEEVRAWMGGENLPKKEIQHAILNWLEKEVI